MNKFKVDDIVYHKSIKYDEFDNENGIQYHAQGTIKKLLDDRYQVSWAPPAHLVKYGDKPSITKEFESNLLTEQEAIAKLNSLEEEFKRVSESIREQMNIAAKALREANKIRKENNRELYFLRCHAGDFLDAADELEWNTSSLFC